MTYNVYIVDDEPMIRYGISSSINWQEYNLKLIGEASNGEAALNFLKENSVDILITDIKMPIMNGLTLISELKLIYPQVQVILISSYNEFEYAQEALRLGVVVDYLLKPTMEPDNLLLCLHKCITKLKQHEQDLSLRAQLEQQAHKESLQVVQEHIYNWFTRQQFFYDDVPGWFTAPIYLASWTISSYDQIKVIQAELNKNFDVSISVVMSTFHLVCIVPEIESKSIDKLTLCHRQLLDINCPTYLVISPLMHDWKKLHFAYELLSKEREHFFYLGEWTCTALKHFNSLSQPKEDELSSFVYKFNLLKEQLLNYISKKNLSQITHYVNQIFELWQLQQLAISTIRGQAQTLYALFSTVQYPNASSATIQSVALQLKTIAEAHTLKSIMALLDETLQTMMKLAHNTITIDEHTQSTFTIQHAILYINETFREELSLQKVADYVHLSKNYFSEQFKRVTGMTYMDYVISLRIQYAKNLLLTTNLKIFDIGEQSGFNSPKHFLKLFKREVKCTPLEFRQNNYQSR